MYKSPKGASTGKKKELKYSKKQLLRCEGKTSLIYFLANLHILYGCQGVLQDFAMGLSGKNILAVQHLPCNNLQNDVT